MISTNLGSVLTNIQTGSTPTTSNPNYFIGDVLWFTPSDIGEEIYLSKTNRKLSKEALLSGKVNVFEKDMLLVTCIGDIGRVGILSQSSTSNQQITALKFIPEIDIIYAYYWFIANKSKLLALANQAVVPILNNERLRELKFYYPTLDFQHHIADILLQADRIRKLRRYSLQLSQSFLQSVYLGMFGDPVTNSHKYSIYRLEDICKKPNGIKAGPFGSSLKKDTYSQEITIYL